MSNLEKKLGTVELNGPSFQLNILKASPKSENKTSISLSSAKPEVVDELDELDSALDVIPADKSPGIIALDGSSTLGAVDELFKPKNQISTSLPPVAPEKLEKLHEPESAFDIIARKQAWFDRPGLRFLARQSSSSYEAFYRAMGIENYDVEQVNIIKKRIALNANTLGRRDKEAELLGELNAIDTSGAQFKYKRSMVFVETLTLSRVSNNAKKSYDKKFQNLARNDSGDKKELDTHPVAVSFREGSAWLDVLSDKRMRVTVFDHVKNYDLVAPFYFLLNSKYTYAPKEAAEIFRKWCRNNGIDLLQALLDYELIDIGGPEPSKISDIARIEWVSKAKQKALVLPSVAQPVTEEAEIAPEAVTIEGLLIVDPEVQIPIESLSDDGLQEDMEVGSPAEISPAEELQPPNKQFENIIDEPQVTPDVEPLIEDSSTVEISEQLENPPAGAAQTEDGIQVPAVFSGITAMADIMVNSATSARPLSEEEERELLIKYDEAFARTQERLLADAQMYLMRALNRSCTEFSCFIDLNKPGFAIHLRFFGEVDVEGEKRSRTEFHVLNNYDDAYKELGIPLTMANAVDLKIGVQSFILNAEGIVPTRNVSAGGRTAVGLDTQVPLPILDYSLVQHTGGMYSLKCVSKDPYNRQLISTSFPLGLSVRYEDEAAEKQELEERTERVIDYLHKVGSRRTPDGLRVHVYKRDVMANLQSWLEANNKEWETAERIALSGFEKGTLLHVFEKSSQKITLAPVSLAMDVGGENPSWHCALSFYIGDKSQKPMGEIVRTRSLYLRTRNSQLAIARTLETLLGVKDMFNGLLPALQDHMRKTGQDWRIEKGDKGDEVFIGDLRLQDFLDDMMRYERNIGVKLQKREVDANGNIIITLQALRCLIGDYGGSVKPVPEYVYEKQGDTRKPVAFTVVVPKSKADSINAFVEKVHHEVGWHADEAYSSVALGADGHSHKRKNPLEYRTVQIRNALIRAVEAIYESHFRQRLPKNWYAPENQTTFSTEPVQSNPFSCEPA